MAFLSENLSKIKPSPGLELQRLVVELKAAGKDVMSFARDLIHMMFAEVEQ